MGYVSSSTLKCTLLSLLIFLFANTITAQEDTISISLRDYHSADITATVASSLYPYYYTGDASGKVLAHSSESKQVIRTIRHGSGIPIKSLRLSNEEQVLTVNQKYDYSDGKLDSVFYISIFQNKMLQENAASLEFIGNQDDAILIQDTNQDKSLQIVSAFDKSYERIAKFYAVDFVRKAAYNISSGQMAMVQTDIMDEGNVIIEHKGDYDNKLKSTIRIPKNLQVNTLFYDDDELYAITYNQTNKAIGFYNLTKKGNFKSPEHQITDYPALSLRANITKLSKTTRIAITSNSLLNIVPIIIDKRESKFKEAIVDSNMACTESIFLKDQNQYVLFESYNSNFESKTRCHIYDINKNRIVKSIPEIKSKYYSAIFLPQNNWMAFGNDLNTPKLDNADPDRRIKYYETGTFNNRFAKLDYNKYLEAHHGVTQYSQQGHFFDPKNGIHAFYGYRNESNDQNKYGFYLYNIIEDKVHIISTLDINKNSIIDYNQNKNILIVSPVKYYNSGVNSPQNFSIIDQGKEIKLDDQYKFAKLSTDGEYLLTISANNQLIISHISDNKNIYEEQLTDGKYKIFKTDNTSFIVSNSYFTINLDSCNQITKSYEIDSSNKVLTQQSNCMNVLDLAHRSNTTAIIVEHLGLIIGDEVIKYTSAEFPSSVSLNDNGSKAMVSFTNGKIRLIDTKTLKNTAEILHIDNDSHVFIDVNNNYFTNIEPDPYILSRNNGQRVPLIDLGTKYYNPSSILSLFGEPSIDYLNALDKAITLKNNQEPLSKNETNLNIDSKPDKKGDLYILSIGVSDYQQEEYNLTYADKDAMDISQIYGNISSEDLKAYKNKFFGTSYYLHNSSGLLSTIKRYDGPWASTGSLYPASGNGSYWIEADYDNTSIFRFEENKSETTQLPSNFFFSAFKKNKTVYPSLDNNGFYFRTQNNRLYHYDINSHKSEVQNAPKDILDATEYNNNFSIQENNSWSVFHLTEHWGNNDTITITKGRFDNNLIRKTSFCPNIISVNNRTTPTVDTIIIGRLEQSTISPNGIHLLYTDRQNNFYYKNLSKNNELPQSLSISRMGASDNLSMSNDGNTICSINKESATDEFIIRKYNLEGKVKEEIKLDKNVLATQNIGGETHWISANKIEYEKSYSNIKSTFSNTVKSFRKTHVGYLVNKNATKASIEKELDDFYRNVKSNDQVVLFLAGHGLLDKDRNYYFAPHDMEFNDVQKKGIAFQTIVDKLKQANTKNKLLLMDSCHSGNTLDMDSHSITSSSASNIYKDQRGSKSRRTTSSSKFKISTIVSDLFADFLSNSGITIISASSGEDVAYENQELGNGAFTSAYINILKQVVNPGIIQQLHVESNQRFYLTKDHIAEIMKQVTILTNGKQSPDLREFNPEAKIKLW